MNPLPSFLFILSVTNFTWLTNRITLLPHGKPSIAPILAFQLLKKKKKKLCRFGNFASLFLLMQFSILLIANHRKASEGSSSGNSLNFISISREKYLELFIHFLTTNSLTNKKLTNQWKPLTTTLKLPVYLIFLATQAV